MTTEPSLRDRALDAAKRAVNASGYWLPVDGQTAVVDAVLALVGAETCCGCEGGPITYRNYRDQPFCQRCADGQPVGAACIHPDGYEGECPCLSSCTCCAPTAATSDACLDVPQLTAVIGYPISCRHCGTTVLLTHWARHLQGHYPETRFGEYEQVMRRAARFQQRIDAARAWARQNLDARQQQELLQVLAGYAPDAECRRCHCPAGGPPCDHCNCCDVPDQPTT